MKLILVSFLFFVFTPYFVDASPELLRPWRRNSNPDIMSKNFEKVLSKLPLNGEVKEKKKYWSSDYWPLFRGGINYRWKSSNPIGFNLSSPGYQEASRMSQYELMQLAPSEKFDLLNGNYYYPLKKEVSKMVSPYRKEWEGICHGWAAAAMNHVEPLPKVVTNPDGIKIPFGSSDIKALLSYYYAYHYSPVSTHQMGRRCNGRRHCNDDMNAGAFHVVVANKVGLEGTSFIADIENGAEVWNQVVYGYTSHYVKKSLRPRNKSANGTVKVARIKTTVRVVFNIVENSWLPSIGTQFQTYKDTDYEYYLDIDSAGRIIGGDWISKNRPDFLWLVKRSPGFKESFSKLNNLLEEN